MHLFVLENKANTFLSIASPSSLMRQTASPSAFLPFFLPQNIVLPRSAPSFRKTYERTKKCCHWHYMITCLSKFCLTDATYLWITKYFTPSKVNRLFLYFNLKMFQCLTFIFLELLYFAFEEHVIIICITGLQCDISIHKSSMQPIRYIFPLSTLLKCRICFLSPNNPCSAFRPYFFSFCPWKRTGSTSISVYGQYLTRSYLAPPIWSKW